jgi:hypothetical protein
MRLGVLPCCSAAMPLCIHLWLGLVWSCRLASVSHSQHFYCRSFADTHASAQTLFQFLIPPQQQWLRYEWRRSNVSGVYIGLEIPVHSPSILQFLYHQTCSTTRTTTSRTTSSRLTATRCSRATRTNARAPQRPWPAPPAPRRTPLPRVSPMSVSNQGSRRFSQTRWQTTRRQTTKSLRTLRSSGSRSLFPSTNTGATVAEAVVTIVALPASAPWDWDPCPLSTPGHSTVWVVPTASTVMAEALATTAPSLHLASSLAVDAGERVAAVVATPTRTTRMTFRS